MRPTGGVLGGFDERVEQTLDDYGRYAGLAFQLVDDLLDFTAPANNWANSSSATSRGWSPPAVDLAMEDGHGEARKWCAVSWKKK